MERVPLKPRAFLLFGLLPIFAALLIYSVTWSFIWDEGFHLIAAQSIANGKRPYIDFCFPQTPLNAYINAAILLVLGNSWRAVHVVAALYICVALWLVADFVQTRLPSEKWRTPCALAAAILFGLNSVVVEFGPAAQAYGIGMLFGTAAFRAAIAGTYSRRMGFAFLTGLFAGSAAASTLLTATVPAVVLAWFVFFNANGSRWLKSAAYLFGCIVPFAPVLWLYSQGPKQTIFNVLQYQAVFRRTNWGDANLHDIDALTDWLNSPEALILIVLFAAALIFVWREKNPVLRREFGLAIVLGAASVAFISTAHPTFERYFSVGVPFLAIAGALGVYVIAPRLLTPRHAWLTAGLVMALGWCMFFRSMFDEREDQHWSDYEEIANSVAEVTPINAPMYADEQVFFLLQRTPPEGMGFSYAAKLELPPAEERLFHIISAKELRQEIQAGELATVQTCRDGIMDDLQPEKFFRQHTEPEDCDLFWEPTGRNSAAKR